MSSSARIPAGRCAASRAGRWRGAFPAALFLAALPRPRGNATGTPRVEPCPGVLEGLVRRRAVAANRAGGDRGENHSLRVAAQAGVKPGSAAPINFNAASLPVAVTAAVIAMPLRSHAAASSPNPAGPRNNSAPRPCCPAGPPPREITRANPARLDVPSTWRRARHKAQPAEDARFPCTVLPGLGAE